MNFTIIVLEVVKRFSERHFFGALLLGAFVLAMGTLAFFPLPEPNQDLFGQGLMALVGSIGTIVGAIWERGRHQKDKPNELPPPPSTPQSPCAGCPYSGPTPEGGARTAIPDSIPPGI